MGCGTHEHTTWFHMPYEGEQQYVQESLMYVLGNLLPIFFTSAMLLIITCTMKTKFAKLLEGTVERTFWGYGVLWGVATTAIGVLAVILYLMITITIEILPHYANNTIFSYFTLFNSILISPVLSILPTIYLQSSVVEVEVAIPYIFLLPARAVFCCRNKQHAKNLVVSILIYVLLWAVLQLLVYMLLLIFAATISPHIIGLCVIIVFFLLTITNFLALAFTISAYYCTSGNRRPEGQKTTMYDALIELLILCFISLFLSLLFFCINMNLITKTTISIMGIAVEMIAKKYIPHILTKQKINAEYIEML